MAEQPPTPERRFVLDLKLQFDDLDELARAQGFPDGYVLTGNQAQRVARIGNAVVPALAEALVRSNLPASERGQGAS